MSDARALTERERARNAAPRDEAYLLAHVSQDGEQPPHQSCGLAAAPGVTSPASGQRGAP